MRASVPWFVNGWISNTGTSFAIYTRKYVWGTITKNNKSWSIIKDNKFNSLLLAWKWPLEDWNYMQHIYLLAVKKEFLIEYFVQHWYHFNFYLIYLNIAGLIKHPHILVYKFIYPHNNFPIFTFICLYRWLASEEKNGYF